MLQSIIKTFFLKLFKAMPKFTEKVVLPTPPLPETMPIILVKLVPLSIFYLLSFIELAFFKG